MLFSAYTPSLQSWTGARPFGQLLRRLIEEGWPLEDIPKETARMEAFGDIEYRGRLRPPARWWLVLLSPELSRMPNGKLCIMTSDDSKDPIDPNHILYVERLSPPQPAVAALPPAFVKWIDRLAERMNPKGEPHPTWCGAGQTKFWDENRAAMEADGIKRAIYRKVIWVKAREKAGLPAETKHGPRTR